MLSKHHKHFKYICHIKKKQEQKSANKTAIEKINRKIKFDSYFVLNAEIMFSYLIAVIKSCSSNLYESIKKQY